MNMEKYLGWLEFDDGDVLDVVLRGDYLIAGHSTNYDIFEDYKMKYDKDESLDANLNDFYEYLLENKESIKIKQKVMHKRDSMKHSHSAHKAFEKGAMRRTRKDAYASAKDVERFLKRALNEFTSDDDGTMYLRLTDDLFVVCGYFNGGLEAKIAYNCDDLQCDYDWDWRMPIDDKSGDVLDTSTSVGENNIKSLSNYFIKEANAMQKEIDRGTASITDSVKKHKRMHKIMKRDSKRVKDSEEIDRQLFTSLIRYGDHPYDGYAILRDGNFVKRIYAESDRDAIKQFRDYLKEKRR